jgi:CheY-like chemotaxis protein
MFKNEIILLVEDDENDVLLLKRAFTKAGLKDNVRVVRNGQDAMNYLSGCGAYGNRNEHPLPFLVLLDLKMPGIDGFDVLQWARKDPQLKRLLIVVLTASNLQTDVDRAYELGANSYLVKPIEFDQMVALVGRFEAYWSELNRIPTVQKTPEIVSVGTSVG